MHGPPQNRWRRLMPWVAGAAVTIVAIVAGVSAGPRIGELSASLPRSDGPLACESWWIFGTGTEACLRAEMLELVLDDGPDAIYTVERRLQKHEALIGPCHEVMHEVAEAYVAERHVVARGLTRHLPTNTSTDCVAGFTHGVVTAVLKRDPSREVAQQLGASCGSQNGRMLQKNCYHGLGHAFVWSRKSDYEAALGLCSELEPWPAHSCAAGLFHQLGLHQDGSRLATEGSPPSKGKMVRYCEREVPQQFLRECWVRAFQVTAGKVPRSGRDIDRACADHVGDVRQACVTAASFVLYSETADPGSDTVRWRMGECARLAAPDQLSCVMGAGHQHDLDRSAAASLADCNDMIGAAQVDCVDWVGGWLAAHEATGLGDACSQLAPVLARACRRGAEDSERMFGIF